MIVKRQLTILSWLLLTAYIALLASRGFQQTIYYAPDHYGIYVYCLTPIMVALLCGRIVTVAVVLFFINTVVALPVIIDAFYGTSHSRRDMDPLFWIGQSLLMPLNVWKVCLCSVIYAAIGSAFAWTCRLRPSESETANPK